MGINSIVKTRRHRQQKITQYTLYLCIDFLYKHHQNRLGRVFVKGCTFGSKLSRDIDLHITAVWPSSLKGWSSTQRRLFDSRMSWSWTLTVQHSPCFRGDFSRMNLKKLHVLNFLNTPRKDAMKGLYKGTNEKSEKRVKSWRNDSRTRSWSITVTSDTIQAHRIGVSNSNFLNE